MPLPRARSNYGKSLIVPQMGSDAGGRTIGKFADLRPQEKGLHFAAQFGICLRQQGCAFFSSALASGVV